MKYWMSALIMLASVLQLPLLMVSEGAGTAIRFAIVA